jgi:hypothetical protein
MCRGSILEATLVSRPDFAQARFVEVVARLTLGDFSGWRGYEARWGVGFLASHRRSFTAPLWLGKSSLDGKTILLRAEQGYGDRLQFVRYALLFAGRGANVIVEFQPELARLLSSLPAAAPTTDQVAASRRNQCSIASASETRNARL